MPSATKSRSWSRVSAWARSPVTQTEILQLVKAVAAAVMAWVLAEMVFGLEQAFLAPWVALLTVHATIHRTFRRGAQTVLAVGAGILLSFVVVEAFGASAWSLGLALLVGLSLARLKVLREEGVTIATTALFVITTGYNVSEQRAVDLLPDRLLDTAIGVVVALIINFLVLPPLNDRSAQQQIDDVVRRLGSLLIDIAAQLRKPWVQQEEDDWIERTRSIDASLGQAWNLVRFAQESGSWNPRRRRHPGTAIEGYPAVLVRLEEGVSQTRSIARHIREEAREAQEWDPRFRDRFIELLDQVGHQVADPDGNVAALRHDLQQLADDLSAQNISGLRWPLYGALIANLQMIVDIVDDVATARPVRT